MMHFFVNHTWMHDTHLNVFTASSWKQNSFMTVASSNSKNRWCAVMHIIPHIKVQMINAPLFYMLMLSGI